jgi:hypothetical protein
MKKWAVGFIEWLNNDLTIVIVEAKDWKAALLQHPKVKDYTWDGCTSLEEHKIHAFDCDSMIDVVEVP